MSEYYTQSPAYQDHMERLAQQVMFAKDEPAPEPVEEKTEQSSEAKSSEENVSGE